MMVNRHLTSRQQKLSLLILFIVNMMWATPSLAHVSLTPVAYQQIPNFQRKCESLGFAVYEKWEKPAGLLPFHQEDCKIGYVDTKGRVVIPPQFDRAGFFREGLAVVGTNINGQLKYGFINQKGRFVIDPEFDGAHDFSDGFAGIRLEGKSGYIDRKGQVVISPQFAEVFPFYRGLARVRIFTTEGTFRGRWGVINKKGAFVVPPTYDHIRHFTKQIIVAGTVENEQWKWSLISWTGETIRKPQLEPIENIDDGTPIKFEGKPKITDNVRNIFGSEEYTRSLVDFSKGMISISIHNQVAYLNLEGELVIGPRFLSSQAFSEGPVVVRVGLKCGYIDKTGKMVTGLRFEECTGFSEGLAQVRIEGKYGFIDKTGSLRINPQFNSVTPFRGGVALAWVYGYQGYIDRDGKFIFRWPDPIDGTIIPNTQIKKFFPLR